MRLFDALPAAVTTPLVNATTYLHTGTTAATPTTPTEAGTVAPATTPPLSPPLSPPFSPAPIPSPSSAPSAPAQVTPAAPNLSGEVVGLGDFTWTQVVTLIGALIAASGVIITLLFNAAKSRRDDLATLYADALGAVAEYREGPYRILRKDSTATTRFAITSKLSDIKTSIDHHQALLRLHARPGVADAYDAFVNAAKAEAGKQMHEAWKADAVTTDVGVNLHVALPRGDADAARDRLLAVMQTDLARRWYNPRTETRYTDAATAASAHPPQQPEGAAPAPTSTT